jgi:hypothetical protein
MRPAKPTASKRFLSRPDKSWSPPIVPAVEVLPAPGAVNKLAVLRCFHHHAIQLFQRDRYLDWAIDVAKGLRGGYAWLEAHFDEAAEQLEHTLKGERAGRFGPLLPFAAVRSPPFSHNESNKSR